MDRLKDDPTALWYFLTIHRDSILHPLTRYLQWKNIVKKNSINAETRGKNRGDSGRQQQVIQEYEHNEELGQKRRAAVALLLPTFSPPTAANGTTSSSTSDDGIVNINHPSSNKDGESYCMSEQLHIKRSRQSTEETGLPG